MDWYDGIATAIAEASGLQPDELDLPAGIREEILDLARIASHDSGQRINAPFLCYAIGFAVARGASLDDVGRVIRSRTGE